MNEKNDLPQRKPTRLKYFDYAQNGVYFITICTKERKNILSKIKNDGEAFPELLKCGEIANAWIRELRNKYPQISVEHYVIMPNHIHMLLAIDGDSGRGDPSPTVHAAIGWLKYQITKEVNQIHNTVGNGVFQRSFYDHIVRNHDDYCEIYRYISGNPMEWQYDKLNKGEKL